MLPVILYIVSKIDGDYAHLTPEGGNEAVLVARALLPEDIEEGCRLKFENLQYILL